MYVCVAYILKKYSIEFDDCYYGLFLGMSEKFVE